MSEAVGNLELGLTPYGGTAQLVSLLICNSVVENFVTVNSSCVQLQSVAVDYNKDGFAQCPCCPSVPQNNCYKIYVCDITCK